MTESCTTNSSCWRRIMSASSFIIWFISPCWPCCPCRPWRIIGGLFLLFKRYITWHIPGSFLATAGVIAWVFGGKGALFTGDPVIHLLSGGMMLGAWFMATDYVTSPSVRNGQILFGVGCGFLTTIIRLKGGFPEGVMFAILIMNCFAPLIDRSFKAKVFGAVKQEKAKESK